MPNRSSKKKRPRDANVLAKQIVDEATADEQPEEAAPEEGESTDDAAVMTSPKCRDDGDG